MGTFSEYFPNFEFGAIGAAAPLKRIPLATTDHFQSVVRTTRITSLTFSHSINKILRLSCIADFFRFRSRPIYFGRESTEERRTTSAMRIAAKMRCFHISIGGRGLCSVENSHLSNCRRHRYIAGVIVLAR